MIESGVIEAGVTGTVADFDEASGLGTIAADDGRTFPFQCTQIADGTRTIAAGRAVTFDLAPRLGRYEATAIAQR